MNLPHFLYCLYRTFLNAYHTSLAVIIIRIGKAVFIYCNAAIWTPGNTGHTLSTGLIIPDGLKYPPVTGLS